MISSNLTNLYKTIIMEHYRNPRNKGDTDKEGYTKVHLKNPTCGDDIEIAIKIENDIIADIRHTGIGCSICCSSASVLSVNLKSKNIIDANKIINAFYDIVQGKEIDKNINMGDAIAYSGVSNFPARIKCATIPWKACEQAIIDNKKEV